MGQRAHIRGRAADIDHHRVLESGKERRAAHRVGRSGREGQHRILLGEFGAHQGAVVLRQIERRGDAELPDRALERGYRFLGEVAEAGVKNRGILALQQADSADLARNRSRKIPEFQPAGSLPLAFPSPG